MIDEGLPKPWPSEAIEAAQKFQQGDLVESPPISYAACLLYPIWELSRQEADAADADVDDTTVQLAVHEDDRPPYGIITSGTCAVTEDRPKPLLPWFQIAPVYERPADAPLLSRDYVHRLGSFPSAAGQQWLADLRIECPLEKSFLVGREPIDPFASEQERIAFGRFLGERASRAAFSENVHAFIDVTLSKHNRKKQKKVGEHVFKLMLEVQKGTRLDPRAVRLHVITREPLDATITEDEARAWFEAWWDAASAKAKTHGVNLLKTRLHKSTSMDLVLYDDLVEIRCPMH